jgi:hypothetical protein
MRIPTFRRPAAVAVSVLALAACTVAAWWLWLGSDTTYQVDPVTGNQTGPYEAPQVIGCLLTLAVLAVLGGLLLRPWIVVAVMTVAFTVSWSVAAAATDESGLWLVGAFLVTTGMLVGTAVFSFAAALVRARRRPAGAG